MIDYAAILAELEDQEQQQLAELAKTHDAIVAIRPLSGGGGGRGKPKSAPEGHGRPAERSSGREGWRAWEREGHARTVGQGARPMARRRAVGRGDRARARGKRPDRAQSREGAALAEAREESRRPEGREALRRHAVQPLPGDDVARSVRALRQEAGAEVDLTQQERRA